MRYGRQRYEDKKEEMKRVRSWRERQKGRRERTYVVYMQDLNVFAFQPQGIS